MVATWYGDDSPHLCLLCCSQLNRGDAEDLRQSVQRPVETLIDRKDSYNMQILQDWSTFRWLRITLLSDPAAKLIRVKVHVFSDSTLCVGVSNPDASKTQFGGFMERAWICRFFLIRSPRRAIHLARTARCFHHSHQEARLDVSERANSRML